MRLCEEPGQKSRTQFLAGAPGGPGGRSGTRTQLLSLPSSGRTGRRPPRQPCGRARHPRRRCTSAEALPRCQRRRRPSGIRKSARPHPQLEWTTTKRRSANGDRCSGKPLPGGAAASDEYPAHKNPCICETANTLPLSTACIGGGTGLEAARRRARRRPAPRPLPRSPPPRWCAPGRSTAQ